MTKFSEDLSNRCNVFIQVCSLLMWWCSNLMFWCKLWNIKRNLRSSVITGVLFHCVGNSYKSFNAQYSSKEICKRSFDKECGERESD